MNNFSDEIPNAVNDISFTSAKDILDKYLVEKDPIERNRLLKLYNQMLQEETEKINKSNEQLEIILKKMKEINTISGNSSVTDDKKNQSESKQENIFSEKKALSEENATPSEYNQKKTADYEKRRKKQMNNSRPHQNYRPRNDQNNSLYSIRRWVEKVGYADFENYITSHIIGQSEAQTVAANVFNYLYCLAYGIPVCNNMLLAAPSGCGKTETFRVIKKYFNSHIPGLPVAQIDMTSITEEGFKGKDTKAMIEPLVECSEFGGAGILFLDEIDKKMLPSYTSNGMNVNLNIMSQLLTTIEGIERDGIDTGKTLFIGMGAFDSCRKKKTDIKSMGFGGIKTDKETYYSPIKRQDMIELGASYEFLGRFTAIVNYRPLSKEAIDDIIDETVKRVIRRINFRIKLSEDMRCELHRAANGRYGCRILESMIIEAIMPNLGNILKNYSREEIIIEILGESSIEIQEDSLYFSA